MAWCSVKQEIHHHGMVLS